MDEDNQTKMTCKLKMITSDDTDMLSNLPDSILCEILSFLPTKNAVATSVLSSRWKFLWWYIGSLKFSDGNQYKYTKRYLHLTLSHFVNRVLLFLKSKSIYKFSLKMRGHSSECDVFVSTWFSVAIARNLKVLKLDIKEDDSREYIEIAMPASLYTCKTLEVLKLRSYLDLDVPKYVCLPNLHTLELAHVNYTPANYSDPPDDVVRRIISGCLSLESLCVERDVVDDVVIFTIDCPTLKFLTYRFSSYEGHDDEDFKLQLNAPALQHFVLDDDSSVDFSFENLFLLKYASICVSLRQWEYDDNDDDALDNHYKRVMKFLIEVQNVKHLWLAGDTLEALGCLPARQKQPICEYARSSKLIMGSTEYDLNSPQDLLEGSKKSHDLYLSKDSSDFTHVVCWKKPEELPICLLSCLETISVSGFKGRKTELGKIAYILKNATMLRKLAISEATSEANTTFKLREEIMKFDRGSGMCEITFS